MTTSELSRMKKAELLSLAKKANIKVSPNILKADLVKTLQKELSKTSAGRKSAPAARAKAKSAAKKKPAADRAKKAAPEKAAPKAKAKKTAPKSAAAKKRKTGGSGAKAKASASKKRASSDRPGTESPAGEKTIRDKAVESKYRLTEAPQPMPPVDSIKIPGSYNRTRLVIMVRDPHWLFAYWEISPEKWRELEKSLGKVWDQCHLVLRVYDRSESKAPHFDIEPAYGAKNWYLNVSPGKRYQAAIGIISPDGKFTEIAVSNTAETPSDRISDVIDDKWLIPDEIFERIFAASGGYEAQSSGSGEVRKLVKRYLEEQMGSEWVSSFSSAEIQKIRRERGFRLWVATELILYGATAPDARVTIQGKEIQLRGDGTFSARFALPDGSIEIPVTAVSGDEVEERTIETGVKKKSKEKEPVIR